MKRDPDDIMYLDGRPARLDGWSEWIRDPELAKEYDKHGVVDQIDWLHLRKVLGKISVNVIFLDHPTTSRVSILVSDIISRLTVPAIRKVTFK